MPTLRCGIAISNLEQLAEHWTGFIEYCWPQAQPRPTFRFTKSSLNGAYQLSLPMRSNDAVLFTLEKIDNQGTEPLREETAGQRAIAL